MTKTVLILGGSGKIGRHAARAFAAAGWTIRSYDRKRGNMTAAAIGADIIVNGLNPPNYHNWAGIIPQITREVIAAAQASGATVILPGNVYNFGIAPGPWDENTPQQPCSRKGHIRVEMESAYRRSGVQTIILRAGNFLDPDRNGDIGSMILFRSIARGKLTSPGNPGATQAWCYLPDWAQAAVGLAEIRAQLGTFTDVPLGGLNHSPGEIARAVEGIMGRKIRITGFPWLIMRLTGPVWELARELLEMRYLWDLSHALDGTRLQSLLPGFAATPLDQVLRSLLPEEVQPHDPVPAGRRITV